MPRSPGHSLAAAALRGSPYSALLGLLTMRAARGLEVFPLHIGDTWRSAPAGARPEEIGCGARLSGVNRYTDVWGMPELRDAIAARTASRTGAAVTRGNVLVTGGATAGLMAAIGALVSPGEDVLLLAPHWPLVEGHVRMAGATPVDVLLGPDRRDPDALVAALEAHLTEKTVALYVNTPNNPSGLLLPLATLEALAAWARLRDLWIFSDEVYEDYAYAGPHAYIYPLAPERTLAAHSLSKAYGLAGARLGWLVGPESALSHVVKLGTHTTYSAPTASQHAALAILAGAGDDWVAEARMEYAATGGEAARRLGIPAPEGGTFLFLDVASSLDDRGLMGFLEDCGGEGLFLAPGASFGPCPTHVRLCFTAAPPAAVLRGVDVLAKRTARGPREQ